MTAATSTLQQEVRRFHWNAFEPRAALLCLPAIAIVLAAGVLMGHPGAAMVMAGGAQTAGFGSFQKPLAFRGGTMVLATFGMAVSATVGSLLSPHPHLLVLVAMFWAFCYGMAGAVSPSEQWIAQQCCTFLVVSSAFPGDTAEALMRGLGVLTGGLVQSIVVEILWRFVKPSASALDNPDTHPPGWRRRAIEQNLRLKSPIFRFALRLCGIAAISVLVYEHVTFHNAYWIPMTALILPKLDRFTTLERGVSRVLGTVIGAGVATLVARELNPVVFALIALILIFIWAAYAFQNVNYAAFVIALTAYIAFDLAIGNQPESMTALHRVIATTIGGAIAIAAYVINVGVMRICAKPGENC